MTYDIPKTMRAVRLHGVGLEALSLDEIPVPVPNDDQLLVRVDAAGVCTSLLKIIAQGPEHKQINGWDVKKFPLIMGDEGAVTVVQPGKNIASQFPAGTRCVIQPAVDHPPIHYRDRFNNNGRGMQRVAVGYTLPGHMADYMLVQEEIIHAECIIPLKDQTIPFFAGALCEPFSCCISAQDRHYHASQPTPTSDRQLVKGLKRGGITMIVGSGPMGRFQAEAALRFKPKHLVIVDVRAERLDWVKQHIKPDAEKAGVQFHAIINDEVPAFLDTVANGLGVDDIVVAVGHRGVQIEAQQWLAKDGVVNLFGGLKRGEHILDLDAIRVHYDEIHVVGSSGGSPADMIESLRMVSTGEFKAGRYLSMVGSLDQAPVALEKIRLGETDGKIVLYPQVKNMALTPVNGWTRKEEIAFIEGNKR
ncbi:MAG: alcohol dehydrogenase catalytic domain-containing protein [Planctomycetota bacterium]